MSGRQRQARNSSSRAKGVAKGGGKVWAAGRHSDQRRGAAGPVQPSGLHGGAMVQGGLLGHVRTVWLHAALPLRPVGLRKKGKPRVSAKQCTACRHEVYVPCLYDVPMALRSLSPAVIAALRPLELIAGAEVRAAGYRAPPGQ